MRERWLAALRANPPVVALADGSDERAIAAAKALESDGVVTPVLVTGGDDPLWTAMEMVATGSAAACVGGATRPTADVLRAAIKTVGLAEEGGLVTSCFLMLLETRQIVAYADCAVLPEPTAEQLAAIAVATAETYETLTAAVPRVALLSYSTHGSAGGASVNRVRAAVELLATTRPSLAVDGELQFDAAFVPEVAVRKVGESEVAGAANVFVFPSLDAGNIAYKITERIGHARAIGPLLQGLARPVHDLSRGCSEEDIYEIAVIAAYQAVQGRGAA